MDTAQTYLNPEFHKPPFDSSNDSPVTDRKKWVKIALIIVLVLGLYLVKSEWWDKGTLVTVLGEGKVKIKTQKVNFNVGITNLSTSSAQAKTGNDLKVKTLKDLAGKFGIKDITLGNYKLATVSASLGKEVFQGVNNATITLSDASKYDSLLAQLKGANFQNITDIKYVSASSDMDQKQALQQAIKDGKSKAEKIKKQLGRLFVGRLTSVNIISELTNQNEVSKTASLVFEIH